MSDTQIAAQQLAQAIARFRLAERDAKAAIDQAGHVFAVVHTAMADVVWQLQLR